MRFFRAAFLPVLVLLYAGCSSNAGRRSSLLRNEALEQYQRQKRIRFDWPLKTKIIVSSYYGWRKGGRMHDGLDLKAPRNTKVYASEAGRVIHRAWISGYGHSVIVSHGGGWNTLYAHLHAYNCLHGQLVKKGQFIGRVGKTGHASGEHLHFEIRRKADPLDPILFMPRL